MYRNQTFRHISMKMYVYQLQGGPETQKNSVHETYFGNEIEIFR